jgi:hypothetical protein
VALGAGGDPAGAPRQPVPDARPIDAGHRAIHPRRGSVRARRRGQRDRRRGSVSLPGADESRAVDLRGRRRPQGVGGVFHPVPGPPRRPPDGVRPRRPAEGSGSPVILKRGAALADAHRRISEDPHAARGGGPRRTLTVSPCAPRSDARTLRGGDERVAIGVGGAGHLAGPEALTGMGDDIDPGADQARGTRPLGTARRARLDPRRGRRDGGWSDGRRGRRRAPWEDRRAPSAADAERPEERQPCTHRRGDPGSASGADIGHGCGSHGLLGRSRSGEVSAPVYAAPAAGNTPVRPNPVAPRRGRA